MVVSLFSHRTKKNSNSFLFDILIRYKSSPFFNFVDPKLSHFYGIGETHNVLKSQNETSQTNHSATPKVRSNCSFKQNGQIWRPDPAGVSAKPCPNKKCFIRKLWLFVIVILIWTLWKLMQLRYLFSFERGFIIIVY